MIDEKLDRLTSDILAGLVVQGKRNALTAIYEIGLECIGADFDLPEMSIAHTTDGRIISGEEVKARAKIANDLKASQRKAWAKACGVEL